MYPEVGVHQGDPLGLALQFFFGNSSFLSKLQSSDSDGTVLTYLDDVFLLGPPKKLISSFNSLKQSFTGIGLTIASNKCEFYCKDTVTSAQIPELLGIPIKSNGTMISNTIWSARFSAFIVQRLCSDKIFLVQSAGRA